MQSNICVNMPLAAYKTRCALEQYFVAGAALGDSIV